MRCLIGDFLLHPGFQFVVFYIKNKKIKKIIRETLNLLACADSSTDTKKKQEISGN